MVLINPPFNSQNVLCGLSSPQVKPVLSEAEITKGVAARLPKCNGPQDPRLIFPHIPED